MKKDYQLADWIIHPELNSVSRGIELTHLEPKVMQVLVELSVHAGKVVHKEDLIRRVWPNTFVGDDVLIRCISELRRVFGDNPRSPRIIQTISKVGYRLIAPVTTLPPGNTADVAESTAEMAGPSAAGSPAPAKDAHAAAAETIQGETHAIRSIEDAPPPVAPIPEASAPITGGVESLQQRLGEPLRRLRIKRWAIVSAVVVLALAGILVLRQLWVRMPQVGMKVVPFTSYPGSERQPAFSPDGNQIVFSWNGENDGANWNLYVKLIGSETPLRVTEADADDLSPVWSPDGKSIAFIRRAQQGNGIYVVPAIGGPVRKLYDLHCAIDWDEPGLSWSPDGKQLVFPDGKSESNPSSLVSLSVDTLQAKPLTSPRNTWDGDYSPAFSPDGRMIAFVRGTDVGSRSVYVMDANGGSPVQITSEEHQIHGLAWTSDSKFIVYSSDASGSASLWRLAASGGTPQRLTFGSDRAYTPAISRAGDRLAYSQGSDTWSILRIDLKSPHPAPARLLSSTEKDSGAQLSHDASRIVFHSRRSGNQEVWISSTSNPAPMKLTSFNGPLTGSPSWSPDDRQIAFDSRTEGWSHIFVMNADGGAPRKLTTGTFNNIIPNWSNDGRWVYFASRRTGSWQIWKVSVSTGQIVQVTRSGGFVARESPDGRWLYYTKYSQSGLWRMPLPGGAEVKILNDPPPEYWAYFSITPQGIYVLNVHGAESGIDFYSFATSRSSRIYKLAQPPVRYSSLTVSADGRWMLFTNAVTRYHDLVLAENFH